MSFIEIREVQEIIKEKQMLVETKIILNINSISYIREVPSADGDIEYLIVHIIGKEKAIKIMNKEDIKKLLHACKQKVLKENKEKI